MNIFLIRSLYFFIYKIDSIKQKLSEFHKKRLCVIGSKSKLYNTSNIGNLANIKKLISIGSNSQILSELIIYPHGGKITIGNHCYIGVGTRIWSSESITVGNRVLISHDVNIHDNISHSLSASERHKHFTDIFYGGGHPSSIEGVTSKPIIIKDDVWIGFNATILKGVIIGEGAVIGACSVVTHDIPPFSIVVGNPARVVGQSRP